MFNVVSILTVALAASSVSAIVVPRKNAPKGWLTEILEPYHQYHTRYLALTCQDFHGKPFFDLCCHPMLANETLERNRDKSCVPTPVASSSASAAEPTSTVTTPEDDEDEEEECEEAEEEEDCEEEEEAVTVAAAPASTYVAPTSVAPINAAPEPTPETTKSVEVTTSKAAEPSSTKAAEPTTVAEPIISSKAAEVTTSKAEEPSTSKAAPTSTKAAEAEPTPAAGGETFSGHATFYFQNGVAGACGKVHGDGELIVAMDSRRYGNTSQKSSLCGRKVKITNTANGKSVVASVEDACPTCDSADSIDLSEGAFTAIAEKETGLVPMTWSFV